MHFFRRMRRLVQIVRGLISWLAYLLLFLTLYFFLALQTTQGEWQTEGEDILNVKETTTRDIYQLSNPRGPLLNSLSEIAAIPPYVAHNQHCGAAPLPSRPNCSTSPAFNGHLLPARKKIVLMMLFGFEVDVLEISLREQLDMVDHIFIVESTITHKGVPKPLMWERLKYTERFEFVNKSKVSHIVVDDQLRGSQSPEKEWYAEDMQTKIGVERIRKWAAKNEKLRSDDIFISANVDEVLSKKALQQLSWCESTSQIITGALWMPMGRLDQALRSGYPVDGRPHTWANPTIYRWKDIEEENYVGIRYGRSPEKTGWASKYVLGGIHMTKGNFLPNAVLKQVSATENLWYPGSVNWGFLLTASKEQLDKEQEKLYRLEQARCWREVMDPLQKAHDVEHYVPESLACNLHRFPYWFGVSDPRNADMAKHLATVRREVEAMGFDIPKPADILFPFSLEPPRGGPAEKDGNCEGVLSVME